jgi:hypothetical protein
MVQQQDRKDGAIELGWQRRPKLAYRCLTLGGWSETFRQSSKGVD